MGGGWPEQHAWETGSAGDGKMHDLARAMTCGSCCCIGLPDLPRAMPSRCEPIELSLATVGEGKKTRLVL
jgi:hypothetical protein